MIPSGMYRGGCFYVRTKSRPEGDYYNIQPKNL